MNNKTSIKVSSFLEAFNKFLSYSDGSLTHNRLSSFARLEQEKQISYENRTIYWNGNTASSSEVIEMYLVEEPCTFYVVKYNYYENSDNSCKKTETSIFVL